MLRFFILLDAKKTVASVFETRTIVKTKLEDSFKHLEDGISQTLNPPLFFVILSVSSSNCLSVPVTFGTAWRVGVWCLDLMTGIIDHR
jgi:hypothetical protein